MEPAAPEAVMAMPSPRKQAAESLALMAFPSAPATTPAARVLFKTPDLFGHVCTLVGSTRQLAATSRAGSARSAEAKPRFVARYLYVIPLEGNNRTAPMVPQAGARLHLATETWEPVAAAEDNQEGEATAFIPTLHALRPAGRRGAQSLSFYAQGRLTDEPRSDSHFVFDAEASRWVRRPSINSSPALASGLYVFARLNDTLYVIGGVDNRVSPSSAVRRLDGDAWVDCAPLNRPRFAPSVCAVPNGLAVLGGFSTGEGDGGEEGLEATLTTERYDARSNTCLRASISRFSEAVDSSLRMCVPTNMEMMSAQWTGRSPRAPANRILNAISKSANKSSICW